MGYRSDVVFAVDEKVYNGLLLIDAVPATLRNEVSYRHDSGVYWHFSGVKRNEDYPDVAVYTEFMYMLDESELAAKLAEERCLYGFLRIGDDDGDREEHGEPWDFDISLNRSIEHPNPPPAS